MLSDHILTIQAQVVNFNVFGGFMQGTIVHSPADLAPFIDHTLLKADATEKDIVRLCKEAQEFRFKAVCVNPIFVKKTRELLGASNVLTASVVGFPLGTSLSQVKALETELAIADGAAEIDMVVRLDLVKSGAWRAVEADISAVVKSAAGRAVKVILETGLLSHDEVIAACKASEAAGAAFVKTATGFLGRGATLEDVRLMRQTCSAHVQVKASGGVKTFDQAKAMIEAGATRLGTSAGVGLVSAPANAQTNSDEAKKGGY
jgi:deoxyribose-phosphate aldolase